MSAPFADLEHALVDLVLADADPIEPPPFAVDTPELAAWAVDKILRARESLARTREQCDVVVERAEREVARTEDWLLGHLVAYHREHPPAKGKTLHLPTGSISSRTVKGGPRIVDSAAALAWAREHLPAAVASRVVESPIAEVIKQHVETTGEVPAGVDIVEDKESFTVKGVK